MRGEFFDFDPLTGLLEMYEETNDGRMHIHTYQDVEPIKDHCQRLRNEGWPDEAWEEKGCSVYATLPLVVVGDMLRRGINIFDQNDIGRVVQEVNTTYSNFKTTYKHHEIK
jgi:hypothetical protein